LVGSKCESWSFRTTVAVPADVVKYTWLDVDVVGEQVALRQVELREEDLALVRDLDIAATNSHPRILRIDTHPAQRD
jgi:hypothetical protein